MNNWEIFKQVKINRNLTIYDTHTHPEEILGLQIKNKTSSGYLKKDDPSLLEIMEFNKLSLFILDKLFIHAPKYIESEIAKKYSNSTEENFMKTLDDAMIGRAVIIPVCFDTNKMICNNYKSNRFIKLGSIDINNIHVDNIFNELKFLKENNNIQGIKLHPNIGKFFPFPSRNSSDIETKLMILIESINKLKLYVLIHGGLSYIKKENYFVKVEYSLLENFFDSQKKVSLFDLIKTPIIIAHLGHYNISSMSVSDIKIILDNYNHVYFDTSGVGPKMITEFLNTFGHDKVVFGSDHKYYSIKNSIDILLKSIVNYKKDQIENII